MFILCVLAYSQNSWESDVDLWRLRPCAGQYLHSSCRPSTLGRAVAGVVMHSLIWRILQSREELLISVKCGTHHHGCIAFSPDISSEQNLKSDDRDQGEIENNKHEKHYVSMPPHLRIYVIYNIPMASSGPQSVARGLTWKFWRFCDNKARRVRSVVARPGLSGYWRLSQIIWSSAGTGASSLIINHTGGTVSHIIYLVL